MNDPWQAPELVYFASDLALVTTHRVVLAGQTFETARIRGSRIASEGPSHHELHVNVDGLEMIGLTVSIWGWLYPIDQAILHARLGHTQYAVPYVAPPPPPPPQPPPLPPTEWGTPLWNPSWMRPWDFQAPYLVPRPRAWPRFAFLATWVAVILLGLALIYSDSARGMLVYAVLRFRKPMFFSWAPLFAFHLVWVHHAWSAIPPECRRTGTGRWMTVTSAVRYFFIPIYALYWQFLAHVGAAEATNEVLAAYGSKKRASTALPWIACILFLLPGPNLLAAPLFLVLHMFSCDAAQAEMLELVSKGPPTVRPLAGPERTPLRFAWLIFAAPILVLCGLAIAWQTAERRAIEEARRSELDTTAGEYAAALAACVESSRFESVPELKDAHLLCDLRAVTSRRCTDRNCSFRADDHDPFKGVVEISDWGRPERAYRTLRCTGGRCTITK